MESLLLQVSKFWLQKAGGSGSGDRGDPSWEIEKGVTDGPPIVI